MSKAKLNFQKELEKELGKKRKPCMVCGKETELLDPILGEDAYCSDCLQAGLRWGLQKWREAGAPGAKKKD